MNTFHRRFIFLAILLLCSSKSQASDWPQWRFGAGHSASSPDSLPDSLSLQWTRTDEPRKQAWDDPLNNDVMQYDRIFEPVVKDGRMFVPYNDSDKVVAIDIETGVELWTFYASGPVRFAPVAWRDVVFFTSDDGHLYCVSAIDGREKWKFRGGPSERKVIGNERVISAWPARGGPVVHEDSVFFAASIWPFMGTFIYSLDAETGSVRWVNDSTSAHYIKQPHSAPAFAGVAPQGTMSIVGNTLLIPGGRSVPAALNRNTGAFKYFDLNAGGKGNGGSFVIGRDDEFYVHTRERGVRSYELSTGKKTAFMVNEPVLSSDLVYTAEGQSKVKAYDAKKDIVWELSGVDASGDLIQSGDRLYAAGGGKLTAIQLNKENHEPEIVWTEPIDKQVVRLLAASQQLFAVSLNGQIMGFGEGKRSAKQIERTVKSLPVEEPSSLAKQLIDQAKMNSGTILWYGLDDEQLLLSVLQESEFQIVLVLEDEQNVERLRRKFDGAGVYGDRITLQHGTIDSFQAPPYIAPLVIVDGKQVEVINSDQDLLRQAYESVRPYGGCLVALHRSFGETLAKTCEAAELENASVVESAPFTVARRVGALTGAADWTHQYGDIANTVKSNDSRVKLPLGLLWFGGNSNLDVLPRHSHAPPEQVVSGRLFVEGMNSLSCRDVYTGRVVWKREFEDLGTFDVYYDNTYKDTPLDTAYNQVHIPGANGRGTNYVATAEAIYLAIGDSCLVLDFETGETRSIIELPPDNDGQQHEWGFIGVYEDVLLGGIGFANYSERLDLSFEDTDSKLSRNSKGFGSKSIDRSASQGLVAFDRHTGDELWRIDAKHSFLHNGVVAGDGKIFCLDKLQKPIEDKLKRRGGKTPDSYRIVATDARSGKELWEVTENIFGTWLGYSEKYQLLLQAGAKASDRLKSEVGQGMAVYHGEDGQLKWHVADRAYSGPCILHNETILTNANSYQLSSGTFNLLTGKPEFIINPITQKEQAWQICRTYGCNTVVASENLLTFRSGAAGYYDMQTMSGTGNLGGFKSGCTSNLVVANGVLNAPDYTRTCSCSYQNQTSLALIHMPEMDMWTVNHTARLSKPGDSIERIGINFGSPGDRTDSNGTLWLDYPVVGGESANVDVQVTGDAEYYHNHTLKFAGPATPWVGASGVLNADTITIPLSIKTDTEGLSFAVATASDDAEEDSSGDVNLTSSDLEFTLDKTKQTVGIRFENVTLSQSTSIDNAYIQFTSDEATNEATQLSIAIEDSGDAKTFLDQSKNISQRQLVDNKVTWQPKPWDKINRANPEHWTPNLAAILRKVIDRPDWKSGNAVAFVITGSGKRVAKAFTGDGKMAARLIVESSDPSNAAASQPSFAHTVRLYFAEPEEAEVGERVFDIEFNGNLVEEQLDVADSAGRNKATIVREFRNVIIGESLKIRLLKKVGQPVLSGVEIIRQKAE